MLLCISLTLLVFCTACSGNTQQKEVLGQITSGLYDTSENKPIWADAVLCEGQLFQGLNLDGVGDSDDEAYVCTYHFDDYNGKNTLLFIHLGTGETLAKVLPVYGHFTFQTGKLLSNKKDAVVLEIEVPGSNYGASDLFVINVDPPGADDSGIYRDPVLTVLLDTSGTESTCSFLNESNSLKIGDIVSGAKVVDVAGQPLQALNIKTTTSTSNIYWDQSISRWNICNG